jgi:protein-tyrosine-phosphatase
VAQPETTRQVLFVCTGNSARSIMAEGLLNQLGHGRLKAYSAGSHPTGVVNPFALATLARLQVPCEGLRSKSWDEFAQPGAPALDLVLTVCDNAAGETCPLWPGRPIAAHWGVSDPAAVQGSDDAKARAFIDAALVLKHRIELLLALPLPSLDAISLRHEIRRIGQQ